MAHQSPSASPISGHQNSPNSDSEASPNNLSVPVDPYPIDSPLIAPRNPTIYYVSFDEDVGCLVVGLDTGFCIFDINPFCLRSDAIDFISHGGIRLVTTRSDYLCLVGGGPQPLYNRNNVMISSNHRPKELSFSSEVKSVKLHQNKLLVVLVDSIHVFNSEDLNLDRQIETYMNPNGLCEISSRKFPLVVAYPIQKGHIKVDFLSDETIIIEAYNSMIVCMAISAEGRLLACSGNDGDSIKIFNTRGGELQHQVVTGYVRAEIYSLALCSKAKFLAVSTDCGSVQLYSLEDNPPHATQRTPEVAHFPIRGGLHHFVAFGHKPNTLLIIGMNGCMYECKFDPVAGKMMLITFLDFMELTLAKLF